MEGRPPITVRRREAAIWLLTLCPLLLLGVLYPELPERFPAHRNIAGQPDRRAARGLGAVFLPPATVIEGPRPYGRAITLLPAAGGLFYCNPDGSVLLTPGRPAVLEQESSPLLK